MHAEEELNRLDRSIQDFRVEIERFFNGAIPTPPEDLKTQIQRQVRQLRNANLQAAADHFRLGSLEARFNSLNELFNRRLRSQELGQGTGRRPAAAAGAGGAASRHDVRRGVVLDDSVEAAAVEALYTGLHQRPGDGPRFDLDSFRTYLKRQISTLRDKTGCREVQFRLSEEDGKLKLKAKPLRTEGSGA